MKEEEKVLSEEELKKKREEGASGSPNNLKKESEDIKKGEDESDVMEVRVILDMRTGNIRVMGPGNGKIYDEPICIWLLDKGQDFVKAFNRNAMRPKIINPAGPGFRLPFGGLKRGS